MSQENVQVVQRGLGSFIATGEPPWDLFDKEIEVFDHDTPDQGVYRGYADFSRYLADWDVAWADWSLEPERWIDAGEWVVVFIRMRTEGRGSGVEMEREDAQVFKVFDGKIVRMDYYNDRHAALRAVGLEE